MKLIGQLNDLQNVEVKIVRYFIYSKENINLFIINNNIFKNIKLRRYT